MKKIFTVFLFSIAFNSYSQDCYNETIFREADSIKNIFIRDSFEIMRETSLKMETQYPSPIIFRLKKGEWYHLIFVPDNSSRLVEVELFNSDEQRIFYEKNKKKDEAGTVVSFSIIAPENNVYNIRLLQINKHAKELCGYFILMRKKSNH